ncbi:MAG: lamin tail domain-containing protein, partial [Myxococcales bacterium]|nr:lamin tail domain-containing protein [Myxococcales bacterium]
SSCGDGMIGGTEACDGGDLGGQDCTTQGFAGGVLACDASCMLDTSGCSTCGDGMLGGTEACDGANLAGQDCTTQGFDGGVLTCSAACTFDPSGCYACGDGVVSGPEECDAADLGGQDCLDLGHTGGDLACDPACIFDETGCTDLPLPIAGEVVFSELMTQPLALSDAEGEWIELYNPTATSFQLRTCTIDLVAPAESITIDVDLVIDPGMHVTLAPFSAGGPGFAPDFEWPAAMLTLPDVVGELQLDCGGVLVDAVAYDDGTTFPATPGATLQLDAAHLDAAANDLGASWCEGTASYFMGDLGTPGADNSYCSVDFCRLQFPLSLMDTASTVHTFYGRLYVEGLTDQSTSVDADPRVSGWVGYGPDGTDPAVDPAWVWVEGMPNAAWDGGAAGEPNNDEYQVDLMLPSVGVYDTAYRFSVDGGATFTYCDGDLPGSSNGYDVAQAGVLETTP